MYTNVIIAMNSVSLLSLLIKLIEIIKKDIQETDTSLAIVFSACFGGYRYIICISQPVKECLIMVYDLERKSLQLADEEIKKIHYAYKCYSKKITMIFFSFILCTFLYVAKPIVRNVQNYRLFNGTTDYKLDMIYESWFPFDENRHYILAFSMHIIMGKKYKI